MSRSVFYVAAFFFLFQSFQASVSLRVCVCVSLNLPQDHASALEDCAGDALRILGCREFRIKDNAFVNFFCEFVPDSIPYANILARRTTTMRICAIEKFECKDAGTVVRDVVRF